MQIKVKLTENESIELKELFLNLLKTNYLTDRQSNVLSLLVIEIEKELVK